MSEPKQDTSLKITMPLIFRDILTPYRYKIYYGGRGSGKSWALATGLLVRALQAPIRVLCTREFQSSIGDSVHKLLASQIERLKLTRYFDVYKTEIRSCIGSSFIFKGIRMNPQEIKSTEGIDICWVEEAQSVTEESWKILTPTIRKPGSEIWISFNPLNELDPTYQRFVITQQPNSIVKKVNWNDNPYFPEVLNEERLHMLSTDPDAYQHVWEGNVLHISDSVIFKNKYEVSTFDTPDGIMFYHGLDWGFAEDPLTLVRCFIKGDTLFIDQECYGRGIDLNDIPVVLRKVQTVKSGRWPIYADSSQPQTINHVKNMGVNITAASKWQGSIEDGITYLRGFRKIVIHERCKHTAEEFKLYSYKCDKTTGEILPIPVDRHNHCIAGYMDVMTKRGTIPMSEVVSGDLVYTRAGWKKVLRAWESGKHLRVLVVSTASGKELHCTADHKILTESGFRKAGELQVGDNVVAIGDDGRFTYDLVHGVVNGAVLPSVYDLTVEGKHEFAVGKNGFILVHNCIDALRYALNKNIIALRRSIKSSPMSGDGD